MTSLEQICQNSLILILGITASYQDIRTRKIRNSILLIILAAFLILTGIGVIKPSPWGPGDIIVNSLIGCVAAIILWRGRIWPAGDAKFFMVLTIIIPLKYYSLHFMPYFPSFALLVNSFLIAFFLLTLMAAADALRYAWRLTTGAAPGGQALRAFRDWVKKGVPAFLKSTLLLMGIFIPARIIGDYATALQGRFFSGVVVLQFVLSFFLYRQIQAFMSKRMSMPLCIAVALAGILVKYTLTGFNIAELARYLLFVLKITLMFMVALNILTKAFTAYIKAAQVKKIPAAQLKKGMLIDKEFWDEYIKKHRDEGAAEFLRPEGLEENQVAALREKLSGEDLVPVLNTYPFAPVIFSGVLLTMALKQSALHYLLMWMRSR